MLSGTRKDRDPKPAKPGLLTNFFGPPPDQATPGPATPAGTQTKVFDAGDGVKVAVTASPQSFVDDQAQWRALLLKDVATIRSRLGWILFLILAGGALSFLLGLFR